MRFSVPALKIVCIVEFIYVMYVRYVYSMMTINTEKKITRFLDFFYQIFLGLGLGKLFPTRESLVSDIPAGDKKSLNLY